MYVIFKYIPNENGIEMPVLIVDTHSEILEFNKPMKLLINTINRITWQE